jgi:hypothetical protein
MPSDPSGVSPKGVLTRPAPDFFDDHMAFGGLQQQPFAANQTFFLTSLVNNATSGIVFKVYGITVCNNGGGGSFAAWVDALGVPGSLVGACQNIRADQGAPYGQIWNEAVNQVGNLPNPFTLPDTFAVIGTGGFDSMTYFSPFPMFIIPVGNALHVTNLFGGGLLTASFWYQQANE